MKLHVSEERHKDSVRHKTRSGEKNKRVTGLGECTGRVRGRQTTEAIQTQEANRSIHTQTTHTDTTRITIR